MTSIAEPLHHSRTDLVSAAGLPRPLPAWVDRTLYPFWPRSFETRDGSLSYVDEGQGEPVLLVHGTPGWSFEWRAVIAGLRARRRVIALDHLGFGLSDKPAAAGYRPVDHAGRLLALFDRLELERVTLVVHDFGGPIGLPLALLRGERVERIVILNSWMWPLGGNRRAARIARLVKSPLGRFLYQGLNASPRLLLPAAFADRERLTKAVRRHYLLPFARRGERVAPWVLGCELTGSDAYYAALWAERERLRAFPIDLIWGKRDPAIGPAELERFTEAFPHARVEQLATVGHYPQEEAPGAVVRAILERGQSSSPQA